MAVVHNNAICGKRYYFFQYGKKYLWRFLFLINTAIKRTAFILNINIFQHLQMSLRSLLINLMNSLINTIDKNQTDPNIFNGGVAEMF